MVDFSQVVDSSKADNGNGLPLDNLIVFPFKWIYQHYRLGNLRRTAEIGEMLASDYLSWSVIGEFLLEMGRVNWQELTNRGYPKIGYINLSTFEAGQIMQAELFQYTRVETLPNGTRDRRLYSLPQNVYKVEDGKFKAACTMEYERKFNDQYLRHFVGRRMPIDIDKKVVFIQDVETSIPMASANKLRKFRAAQENKR